MKMDEETKKFIEEEERLDADYDNSFNAFFNEYDIDLMTEFISEKHQDEFDEYCRKQFEEYRDYWDNKGE